jgi:hypothetical protein
MRAGRVRVGEVLELRRRPIAIDPLAEYISIGVRSFGRGIFHYEPKPGAELSKLRFFEVQPGELVISNIKGWEGAIAVSSDDDHRCIASNRFLTYVSREGAVDVGYLRYFFLSDGGLPLIQRASPGSADRNRTLAIDRFEALEIPLPGIAEQRSIARRLDKLVAQARTAQIASAHGAPERVIEVMPALVEQTLERHSSRTQPVGELVEFVNDLMRPGNDPAPAEVFVGLEHLEQHTGRRLGSLPLGDEKGRKFRFQPGDVLYGYLRPYQNKVWLADVHGLCSVEQYVLRPKSNAPAEYLAFALRSRPVLAEAIRLTHNLQLPRLRSGLLGNIAIPVVDGSYEPVLAELRATQARMLVVADRARDRAGRLSALEPSILNHAFAGLRDG